MGALLLTVVGTATGVVAVMLTGWQLRLPVVDRRIERAAKGFGRLGASRCGGAGDGADRSASA
jgi:hypothetical protein